MVHYQRWVPSTRIAEITTAIQTLSQALGDGHRAAFMADLEAM